MKGSEIYIAGLIGFAAGLLGAFLIYVYKARPAQLRKMKEQLKQRNDQFIGLASHYLLTPITVIQSAVSSLQEGEGTLDLNGRTKLYEAIVRGQQRLFILAEQFLLVSQLERGDLKLSQDVVDVNGVISDAIATVDPFAREKEITFRFRDSQSSITQSRLDARRMRQAFVAVLDNAIKFSPERSVIEVEATIRSGVFTVCVTDHGIGMPEQIMAHASEQFFRGSEIYNFDYEGIGLGLYIAQSIIQLHQGMISFQSKTGQGTVVVIEFPNL